MQKFLNKKKYLNMPKEEKVDKYLKKIKGYIVAFLLKMGPKEHKNSDTYNTRSLEQICRIGQIEFKFRVIHYY
jgi:hypothetical protein